MSLDDLERDHRAREAQELAASFSKQLEQNPSNATMAQLVATQELQKIALQMAGCHKNIVRQTEILQDLFNTVATRRQKRAFRKKWTND